MILTCPACATQYAVKDGAIPPGGRKVRCASCKHSWHQDPDGDAPGAAQPDATGIAPPPPDPGETEPLLADIPDDAASEGMIAEEPQPDVEAVDAAAEGQSGDQGLDDYAPPPEALEVPLYDQPDDDGFASIPAMRDEEDEPRRGGALRWLIGLVLLVVAAAAAFWFLAPPELKARAGIREAGATELQLMLITSDRQKLASGNELLAISGRIINPTDRELPVPPIKAELRNKTSKALVYQWTIAPPASSLPPRGTASFNSAEIDIPQGGDELTVTLGESAG